MLDGLTDPGLPDGNDVRVGVRLRAEARTGAQRPGPGLARHGDRTLPVAGNVGTHGHGTPPAKLSGSLRN